MLTRASAALAALLFTGGCSKSSPPSPDGRAAFTSTSLQLKKVRAGLAAAPQRVPQTCPPWPGNTALPTISLPVLEAILDARPDFAFQVDPAVNVSGLYAKMLAVATMRMRNEPASDQDDVLRWLGAEAAALDVSHVVVVRAGSHRAPKMSADGREVLPGAFEGDVLIVDVARESVVCGRSISAKNGRWFEEGTFLENDKRVETAQGDLRKQVMDAVDDALRALLPEHRRAI
jgi:hypothetical protein